MTADDLFKRLFWKPQTETEKHQLLAYLHAEKEACKKTLAEYLEARQ